MQSALLFLRAECCHDFVAHWGDFCVKVSLSSLFLPRLSSSRIRPWDQHLFLLEEKGLLKFQDNLCSRVWSAQYFVAATFSVQRGVRQFAALLSAGCLIWHAHASDIVQSLSEYLMLRLCCPMG